MSQLVSYWQFRVTAFPTSLSMSGWSWVTLWATPDPVEKRRKQSWNTEQNNVEIRPILDPNIYKPNWNPKMLAFLQSPFFPKSLWSSMCLCAVLSLRVLNTRTHVWKHPYQRRWRPGTPRAGWSVAWGMDSLAQMCLILLQAKISVSLSAWQHIYTVPGSCVAPPPDRKWHLSCS